ncbi:hypothetical protein HO133_002373 [Letharia lupina]|uniref:Uncharacterized protein n=1 Tax=Letharia lupina TaxID=560253 RepID=A0A8H6CDL8_9LECA|nr:uncharacterized protein HO133_002373 [Letharia lupina]KAF6221517.1 hypothetical protein HO133_002373 [Letharia lupina]
MKLSIRHLLASPKETSIPILLVSSGYWYGSNMQSLINQNMVCPLALSRESSASDSMSTSPASLSRHLTEPYYKETPYSDNKNASLTASLWHDIDIDSGVITLSDDYVASKGLLPAQRFPWDATKGIYIVHGYHNLHCLVTPPPFLSLDLADHQIALTDHRKSSTSP